MNRWQVAPGWIWLLAALVATAAAAGPVPGPPRPNILWISCEDMSPDLGCYGDRYAVTPNLDRLAAEGVRYTRVFATAGVCAPARSAIITGHYATSIGTHPMRCQGVPPPEVRCFTEWLRAAGYYCTNNVKTDYQFPPPLTAWDENSPRAHWRGRRPGQPFFAVFNFTITHESQIRNESPEMHRRLETLHPHERHDPARATLPPYYPDTPVVRRDWARYYDLITLMDRQVGELLRQLDEDGLADETIVWFWSDHGRGLPRAKRWLYDSGVHVPLIVRIPEKWRRGPASVLPDRPEALRPGSVNDELVSFVDFAPTVLALAGVAIPAHLPGRAFLGPRRSPRREYVFGGRDRMDETYDLIRYVRDRRFKYLRNYMPHVGYGLDIAYMNEMPTMREMRRLYAAGALTGAPAQHFRPTKPVEELFDTEADPHELRNLAGDPRYRDVLLRMRRAHERWARETGDVGLIPEPEFDAMKSPRGEPETTAPPAVRLVDDGVALACATPGASIAYRLEGDPVGQWRLFVRPIRLAAGETLRARACRIGYRDSTEVHYRAGDPPSEPSPAGEVPPGWWERLAQDDLLARLRRLRTADLAPAATAIARYTEALADPHPAVRYWAIVGLQRLCREGSAAERARDAIAPLLRDPSWTVRIGAAEALAGWGHAAEALPVLVEGLRHRQESMRLWAITSLHRLGEQARPALAAIRAARTDSSEYVRRMTEHALRTLRAADDDPPARPESRRNR